MNNNDKLINSFVNSLVIPIEIVNKDLSYQSIPQWDSISHMVLISEIEADFDVCLETDDVISLNSFESAREILSRYGFNF